MTLKRQFIHFLERKNKNVTELNEGEGNKTAVLLVLADFIKNIQSENIGIEEVTANIQTQKYTIKYKEL